jgi:effector-binding domain-containing protein
MSAGAIIGAKLPLDSQAAHGAFSGFGAAYAAIESWIQANGYQHSGPAREVYLSMPGDVASPANITEIQLPVGRV